MSTLRLEIGEDQAEGTCFCCGESSWTGHGFVYKNNEPYAVYFVGASDMHREDGVTFAIAIGEWTEDEGPEDRVCLGLQARESGAMINFRFIEREESPWGSTELLGDMLPKSNALVHPARRAVLDIAELIVSGHPAVCRVLHSDG
jgi:hypothetical protein